MKNLKASKIAFIKLLLWGVIFYSALAVIYHTRWFIPYLLTDITHIVPNEQIPFVWFVVQIFHNIIFLVVAYLLFRLFKNYQRTGFFDEGSAKIFDGVIFCSIALAVLGVVQTIAGNFNQVHINEWTSVMAIANLSLRSFTKLLIFQEPQTFYILLAILLWVVKQFVTKAVFVKTENEAFI